MLSLFRRNKKGQAALFIVLVFQVLFILFAMSLNVAMVVYDKINFQNSLDLAAYYGAKKQAEVLNAMAHINYQMRQNWKLLSWRYRILGTLVQYQGDYLKSPGNDYWCPQNNNDPPDTDCHVLGDECQESQNLFSENSLYPGYCDVNYFTCISHDLWARGIDGGAQNLCTTSGVGITPIRQLPLSAPFLPEAHIASGAVEKLIGQAKKSCPLEGALNWLTVQLFLTHFRLDQKDRKMMIRDIYNRTLKEGKDLDGEDILEGTEKVFFHNLTKANQANTESLPNKGLKEFQSFKEKDFETFFEELQVRPLLNYLDSLPDQGRDYATCKTKLTPHFLLDYGTGYVRPQTQTIISSFINKRFERIPPLFTDSLKEASSLFLYNAGFYINYDPLAMLTLSFFKKPEQTLYYGLSSEFEYKPEHQIFSLKLSSGISFKGSAFAKAFGGSFGPQPEQSDPFIPTQHSEAPLKFVDQTRPQLLSYVHQPNYSRWPGDQWGLVDRRLHDPTDPNSFLNKQNTYSNTQPAYAIKNYFHNILGEEIPDPLAREEDPQSFIRMMEWMAVYPDLYDINYYSILANYHQTYFEKICKLLKGSKCDPKEANSFDPKESGGGENKTFYIRGDFGWPDSDDYIKKDQDIDLSIAPYFLKQGDTSIKPEELEPPPPSTSPSALPGYYTSARLIGPNPDVASYDSSTPPPPPLTQGNLFYPWLAKDLPEGLLSSWFNPKPLDYKHYEFDNANLTKHFVKCEFKALKDMPVSSSCVGLGRTGYSIKLISCEKVKKLKPAPPDIDSYCD